MYFLLIVILKMVKLVIVIYEYLSKELLWLQVYSKLSGHKFSQFSRFKIKISRMIINVKSSQLILNR